MSLVSLILAGVVGGFLAGLLGVGGGVIFIFVLSIYFQNHGIHGSELPKYLISNSIFATFFAGLSSSIKNYRIGNFYPKAVVMVAVPGVVASILLAWSIVTYSWYDKRTFTIFFVALLIFFLSRLIKKSDENQPERIRFSVLPIVGLLSGIVSALSGLGGGVVMIPLLREFNKMKIQKASSISLGVIPIFAFSMSVFYALQHSMKGNNILSGQIGYIDLKASLPLAIGVTIAAPFGVRLAQRLSQRLIKVMFASVLVIVALKLIYSGLQ